MLRKASGDGSQARQAHTIDVHVGRNVRYRRERIGASQELLAAHLGLSFQQVQKYERGMNRISAGRLVQIAGFLGVRVESFFEGLVPAIHQSAEEALRDRDRLLEFAMTREGAKWNEAYLGAHPDQRKVALDVLRLPVAPPAVPKAS
jgi:transcriptional regulator with XRE-family HTH domain